MAALRIWAKYPLEEPSRPIRIPFSDMRLWTSVMPLPIAFMRILTNARDAKEKMRSSTKSFRDTTDPIEEASQPNRCHVPVKRVPGWMATIRNHFA
jgi:hypothetical protein